MITGSFAMTKSVARKRTPVNKSEIYKKVIFRLSESFCYSNKTHHIFFYAFFFLFSLFLYRALDTRLVYIDIFWSIYLFIIQIKQYISISRRTY